MAFGFWHIEDGVGAGGVLTATNTRRWDDNEQKYVENTSFLAQDHVVTGDGSTQASYFCTCVLLSCCGGVLLLVVLISLLLNMLFSR